MNNKTESEQLMLANRELAYQNKEKDKRAAELAIANKELAYQNNEKDKRAEELVVANNELAYQNIEKVNRADELVIINDSLKQAKEKTIRANALYAFISQVNQNIVRVKDEKSLFRNSCQIAIEFGKFKMAWIGMCDAKGEKITLVGQCGMPAEDVSQFFDAPRQMNDLQEIVFKTHNYYVCNNIGLDFPFEDWKSFMAERDYLSCMILPIKKMDKIIGTFNLYASEINYFDKEEIALLVEMTEDISFALNLFEKAEKQMETELLIVQNEKRFRALIEHGDDMKTLTDENGIIRYGSTSIKKILGYSEEDFLNKPSYDFMFAGDIPNYIKNRSKILESFGKSFSTQVRMLHKNGSVVWCEGTITNLLKENGIQAIVSNFRDISEKKKSEQVREFDTNNLNALINNTKDLLWSVDKDFKLITSNLPFDEIIKLMTGRPITKGANVLNASFSIEQREKYKKFYERAFAGESFIEIEYTDQPVEFWSEISFYPILKGKEVAGTACHSRDITERKKAEIKLKEQNEELIKTNTELDRFVYSTSHDLRAPLSSLLGLISLLTDDAEPGNGLQIEQLSMLKSSVVKLDNFIEDILNYSRNARTEKSADPILFEELIEETCGKLMFMEGTTALNVQVKVEQKGKFISDKRRINVILTNLISNALKYQDSEKKNPFVKVSVRADMENAIIVVEDNGIGIIETNKGKIFEMFYRGSDQSTGSGLGLYIVKETTEKLGATITLESELLKGSKFTIVIPNSLNYAS